MSGQRILDGLREAAQHAGAQTGEPTDADLLAVGYAPGGYMSACRDCGSTGWDADKWATRCRPCAVIAWNRRSEPRGDSPLGFASALASGGNRDPEPSSAADVVAKLRKQARYHYMPASTRAALGVAASLIERLASAPKAEVEGWLGVGSAPQCVASSAEGGNGRRPVIVTRWPVNGCAPPMAIARLTAKGWISGRKGNRLWFDPTHWRPLPAPPPTRDKPVEGA